MPTIGCMIRPKNGFYRFADRYMLLPLVDDFSEHVKIKYNTIGVVVQITDSRHYIVYFDGKFVDMILPEMEILGA